MVTVLILADFVGNGRTYRAGQTMEMPRGLAYAYQGEGRVEVMADRFGARDKMVYAPGVRHGGITDES